VVDSLFSFLVFALFFYFMMRHGCVAHAVHGHHHHKEKVQDYIDVVCGQQVSIDEGYGKMYQKKLFRFCSRECLDKFEAHPENFINSQQPVKGGQS
jgi:YHS domain-containing protein